MVAINQVQQGMEVNMQQGASESCGAGSDKAAGQASADQQVSPARVRRRGLRLDACKQREKAIDQLVSQASERGDCVDRFYWMLVYDLEMAPMTSNMQQLTDIGIILPAPQDMDERALQAKVWEVIESLGDLGVYLLNTNHLCDRDLYTKLFEEILPESVRDLPPTEGVSEFIDLRGGAQQDEGAIVEKDLFDRDRFLPKP